MKKTFLILFITLLASVVFAFPAGTLNLGGDAGFSSYKADSDAKALNIIYFNPNIGYLFMDNLSADLLLLFMSSSQEKAPGVNLMQALERVILWIWEGTSSMQDWAPYILQIQAVLAPSKIVTAEFI